MTQLTEILEILRSIDERLASLQAVVRHPLSNAPDFAAAGHSTGASERRVPRYGPHIHANPEVAKYCVVCNPDSDSAKLLAERARKLPGGP